ncbi:MAG TPA: helix-turn-helix domain-containing protein [Streptosporangiaceae bacterium]|jgi:AcrR family transcriptional regulator|nr:helix-turn-helix domain-containing protein [Streptosporangiaceae bacterium]
MSGQRGDTREKIRAVALELFAEQGYEKTSLREIAERLGVTKAALYYHFKSKEDIVASLYHDVQLEVEKIIAWGDAQPRTMETRRELIRRYYAAMTRDQGSALIRFMQDNHTAVQEVKAADQVRERFLRLAQLVTDPEAELADQLRARMAFFALNASAFALRDLDVTDEQRHEAALAVALDLVSGSRADVDLAPG